MKKQKMMTLPHMLDVTHLLVTRPISLLWVGAAFEAQNCSRRLWAQFLDIFLKITYIQDQGNTAH